MTTPNLTDDDRADLARFLRHAIEADRYPLSPPGAPAQGAAGEDRPGARAGRGAVAGAEGAGEAELGAGEEASAVGRGGQAAAAGAGGGRPNVL